MSFFWWASSGRHWEDHLYPLSSKLLSLYLFAIFNINETIISGQHPVSIWRASLVWFHSLLNGSSRGCLTTLSTPLCSQCSPLYLSRGRSTIPMYSSVITFSVCLLESSFCLKVVSPVYVWPLFAFELEVGPPHFLIWENEEKDPSLMIFRAQS